MLSGLHFQKETLNIEQVNLYLLIFLNLVIFNGLTFYFCNFL